METSILATREVELVIIESGSTADVGYLELITSYKLEVVGYEDVIGMEISSLVDSSSNPVCSIVGMVEGSDDVSSVAIKSPVGKD